MPVASLPVVSMPVASMPVASTQVATMLVQSMPVARVLVLVLSLPVAPLPAPSTSVALLLVQSMLALSTLESIAVAAVPEDAAVAMWDAAVVQSMVAVAVTAEQAPKAKGHGYFVRSCSEA